MYFVSSRTFLRGFKQPLSRRYKQHSKAKAPVAATDATKTQEEHMNYLQLSPYVDPDCLTASPPDSFRQIACLGATVTVEISYYVLVDAIMASIVHARAEEMTPIDV